MFFSWEDELSFGHSPIYHKDNSTTIAAIDVTNTLHLKGGHWNRFLC